MSLEQAASKTYSDAWHRVATVRAELRHSVTAHRQFFRGEPWVILRDRFSSDWYRVSPQAYDFLCRLSLQQTIAQVWEACLVADPHGTLTQEEVVQLIGQMNLSNLISVDRGALAESLFERFSKRVSAERKALVLGFLSIKLPLLDPDRWLEQARKPIGWIFSPLGAVMYSLLLLLGGKALMDNADRLFDQTSALLAPSNLGLLYVGFLIAKLLHELGHAALCKRFGGEVHKLGVMFLIFAPMPYVDATSAWGLRNRTERVLVGLGGVLVELGVAAMAALIWAHSAPGTVHALAYNIMLVASVSTLVFNLNPLLRFDGYHLLVDLLDVPNLFQRSREQLRYLGERYFLRLPHAQGAARTPTEAWLLPLYGLASIGYWLALMSTIVVFVAGQYLELGILLAFVLVFTSILLPIGKFLLYLTNDARLGPYRARAVSLTATAGVSLMVLLTLVPMPDRLRVPGVLEAERSRALHSETDGFFVELLARPGEFVQKNQPLLRLSNLDLEREIEAAQMRRQELMSQEIRAISKGMVDYAPLARQRQALEENLSQLLERQEALLVRAPIEGVWSASELAHTRGQWMARGASLGTLVQGGGWRFVAVLPQIGSHVFDGEVQQAEVRLRGEESMNVLARQAQVMPFEQGILPSRALGMAGGGAIAVSPSDPNGLTATEPFFRVEARIEPDAESTPALFHGRTGVMRITLSSRPLLSQWERELRQFLQRRFRV